jgi:diaminohydroxyphosphoribosylaminopyrimidine deaminase/5-amino-6-(5-phosphoribosylamino)uracil reductase
MTQISIADREYMARALQLAERGLYTTTPNPRVGCLLVDPVSGRTLGEGFHRKAGEGHAEVNALQAAGDTARGATAYVTLEPCSHTGKTGPCSDALITAGVARVVYAMEDPNPAVAGRGVERLRAAGIQADGPLMETQAEALNPGFIKRMRTGLPWVRCKLAMSLDGRTAMASGESQWITGPCARADVQRLRARSCAIVTGVETLLQDQPALTVRDPAIDTLGRQPLRVIVDSRLRSPADAGIFRQPGRTCLASARAAVGGKYDAAINVWHLPGSDERVDLHRLLQKLAAEEACNEVMIEAGPTLAGSFMADGLVDELQVYMAGILLGNLAKPLLELPFATMSQRRRLQIIDIRALGEDWRITARPEQVLPSSATNAG